MEHLVVLQLEKQVMVCFEGLPKSSHSSAPVSVSHGLSGSSALGTSVVWSPGDPGTVLCKPNDIKGIEPELLAGFHGTISAFQKWGVLCSLRESRMLVWGPVKRDWNVPPAVQWQPRAGCVWWSCSSCVAVSTDLLGLPRTFNGVLFL